MQLGLWALPGDVPTGATWSIGSTPFGNDIGSGTSALSSAFQYTNGYGYDLYESTFSLNKALPAGTYYLTLTGGADSLGSGGYYWDETDGPSTAYDSIAGAIPSESFELYGTHSAGPDIGSRAIDNGSLIFDSNSNLTVAASISGSGSVTQNGTGTTTLTGVNPFTGGTTVNAGIVNALDNAALGNNGAVTVDQGASLNFSGQVLPGLSGTYYNAAPNNPNSTAFDSLRALTAYVATLPVITTDSSTTSNGQNDNGNNFDYGSTGQGFPATVLTNPNQFIGVWSGEFDAQVAGLYTFSTASDDGSMLFIDGNVVVNNNNYQGITTKPVR